MSLKIIVEGSFLAQNINNIYEVYEKQKKSKNFWPEKCQNSSQSKSPNPSALNAFSVQKTCYHKQNGIVFMA